MLEIAIGFAAAIILVAVPWLRRATLSALGLFGIIGAGVGVFALAIWGVLHYKSLLVAERPPDPPSDIEEIPLPARAGGRLPVADDLASALAQEDALRAEERALLAAAEVARLEQERQRVAALAEQARAILEEDRKLSRHAAAYPLTMGSGSLLADIIAIRIPAWRDRALAAEQSVAIRTWLHEIGLDTFETADIATAKAWGSLYDLWVEEHPEHAPVPPETAGE